MGVNLGVALLLGALVWFVLDRSRHEFENDARNAAEGLTSVAQLNIQSEIDRIDGVLRATASELERLMAGSQHLSDATINEILRARYDLLKGIEAFRLTDASGLVRWGTDLPDGAPLDISDREYFREIKSQRRPTTLIGGPLKSRASGHWIVTFAHPVRLNGRFSGLLYVSLGTAHFRRMFQQYTLGPLDAISLRRDDRRLIARFSPGNPTQGEPGDASVSQELVQAMAEHPRTGTIVSRVAVDGEMRTSAYRKLDSWPLIILAGINHEQFFKPWRQQAATVVSLAVLAWALVAAATWRVQRSHRRLDAVMQALADQGKRIQALMRTAGDGIHIIDRTGHLVEMSDSFAEMLKSSREKLLGRNVASWDANHDEASIDAWLATIKPGDRQRVDVQHRRDDGQVIDVELQLSVADIAGQFLVFASARDVTSQRRLMREQAAMLDTDLVGMAKIERRTITWRNRALERILGYGQGELQGLPVRELYWDDASCQQVDTEGYEALKRTGYYRSQIRMRRKDGELVWVDFGAVQFSSSEVFVMLVDITATKKALESWVHAASHDPLTHLPNRTLLHDRLAQALAVARRQRKMTAICYLDLDGFKPVNDQHGHAAGDHLLKTVAHRLVTSIRPSDTAARLGGDEFALVLVCVEEEEWRPVLDRIVDSVMAPVELDSRTSVSLGVTVGVTIASFDEVADPQELIARADQVMLRGKRAGKGKIFV